MENKNIGNLHILVVDDNPINLKLARVLLLSEGYPVETASDAESAIRAIANSKPKIILMDIQLPDMDGLELTRRLKAQKENKDIIIIALTAYAMKGDQEIALAAGCDGYVTKPIDPPSLRQLLQKLTQV